MELQTMPPVSRIEARSLFKDGAGEVVEIPLLLPTARAEALVALSRKRQQSVGQILRQLIDRALMAEEL
jgi:hypothetical protein